MIEYKVRVYAGRTEWLLDGVWLPEEEFLARTQPAKEYTVADLEEILGYPVKIIG